MERTSSSRKSSVRLRKYSEPQADASPLTPPTTSKTKTISNSMLSMKSGYMAIIELMSSDGFWELTQSFADVLAIKDNTGSSHREEHWIIVVLIE